MLGAYLQGWAVLGEEAGGLFTQKVPSEFFEKNRTDFPIPKVDTKWEIEALSMTIGTSVKDADLLRIVRFSLHDVSIDNIPYSHKKTRSGIPRSLVGL